MSILNDRKFSKVRQRVTDALGMAVEDDETPEIETSPLVPIPTENDIIPVDNIELPSMVDELKRFEHTQRQSEVLLDVGIPSVQNALGEIATMPPMYRARAMEASSELFKAVTELLRYKGDSQLKMMELRMKMAAFGRVKETNVITGNTMIFNREELIRAYTSANEEQTEDT